MIKHQKITIGTMITFASFFLALLIVHPDAFQARHLQDVSIHENLESRPLSQTVELIQMVVTGVEERSPPSLPLSYGRVISKAPPPPKEAPTQGQTTLGRDHRKAPPPPKVAPSHGETTYEGEYNPNSKSQTTSLEKLTDVLARVLQKPNSLTDRIIYGQDDTRRPLRPNSNGSDGRSMFGRDDPRRPLSPDPNGSDGQSMLGRDDTRKPLSPDPNGSDGQGMFGRDYSRKPLSSDPNSLKGHRMYG